MAHIEKFYIVKEKQMGKVFAIADLHLGHKNMALHRGFNSVEEHDSHIIECWNNVVGKKDTVIICGDLTMEKATEYYKLGMLKGIKKVVGGNHDKPQHASKMLEYVSGICGALNYKGYLFTHVPIHTSELRRFRGNIHGHVHEKTIYHSLFGIRLFKDKRYINVSCENINYTPIEINKINQNKFAQ